MRRKCGQQYHPPNAYGCQKKRRQQNGVGRPKNRNWMWSESQRESNLRSEKIASEDKQRDGNNAPIKKLVATPVCFRMRTIPRQFQWRGQVFHPSNSLFLIGEVGSFMLIKLPYKAMIIKKMEVV